MLPKLLLALSLTLALSATPITFPDGVSIKGDTHIGAPLSGPGVYLFGLEDLPCPSCDFDYNDLLGTLTLFEDQDFYSVLIYGGIGDYFNRGLVGFAGTRFIDGVLTLIFNTPSGEMFSGTPQVWLYKVSSLPTPVPEPTPFILVFIALFLLLGIHFGTGEHKNCARRAKD